MWIYDGEQWIDDSAGTAHPEPERPRYDERMMPELQIVPREDLERPQSVPQPSAVKRRRRGPRIGHA